MIRRMAVALAAAGTAVLVPALPAAAHGSPTTPISRTTACAGNGTATGTAACKAARTANGGQIGSFDNLRIANVNGNDRKRVPDGQLCSGGLDQYKGLDLARDDFPSTTVTGGRTLAIKYRTTIPHEGSFRIYLTRQGYDPADKLTWADLPAKPIVEVKDPPIRDGAYVMSAKLPSDRTGRHILYIVWENTSTPDTYYSCSDLVFKAAAAKTPKPSPSASRSSAAAEAKPAANPGSDASAAPPAEAPAQQAQQITPVAGESQVTLGHQIIAGALILGIGALLWAAIGGLLRKRRENR